VVMVSKFVSSWVKQRTPALVARASVGEKQAPLRLAREIQARAGRRPPPAAAFRVAARP
jgi:hypothetical protein